MIRGEDTAQLLLQFSNGATALWDANRYNETKPSRRATPLAACASTEVLEAAYESARLNQFVRCG